MISDVQAEVAQLREQRHKLLEQEVSLADQHRSLERENREKMTSFK